MRVAFVFVVTIVQEIKNR